MHKFVGVAALILVASAGCASGTTDPLRGLSFVASTSVSSVSTKTIATTAAVKNDNPDPVTVGYGACALDVILHTGSYDGPVVYESFAGRACILIALQKTLAPGESLTLTETDSPPLASGSYFVTVRILVNGSTTVPAGTVTF